MRFFDEYSAHTLTAAALCAMIAIGCGQESNHNSAILQPVNTGAGGSLPTTPGYRLCFQGLAACVPASLFEATCQSSMVGGNITTKYGPTVCVVTREYGFSNPYSFYTSNRLPVITPTEPRGGVDTGIRLRKGARLDYSTTKTGKWGYLQASTNSIWGGAITFNWFSSKTCASIDWNGMGSSGQLTNEGQPAGLFGSDGIESFYLGGSSATRSITIQNDGTLHLGINADPTQPYGCTTAGYPRIRQTTCEDANGASYTCI